MVNGVTVSLNDGRTFPSDLICTDPVGDVALFKMKNAKDLPFLEFGDSDKLEVGQYVIAVGNPLGLAIRTPEKKQWPTVSLGLVSALHRNQQQYSDCIQTDAAVNPGNSGGPLCTLDGKFVGINGRIATRYMNRVNSGVGYAISSNQIKRFLPQMMEGGIDRKIHHGQVNGLTFDREPSQGTGAKVRNVEANSTAGRAGFLPGDVIVQVEEYKVFSSVRFQGIVGNWPMDTQIGIKVQRDGKTVDLKVRLDKYQGVDIMGQRPNQQKPKNAGYLGVNTEDTDDGTKITNVVDGSPAEAAGLRAGDLILKIDGVKVNSAGAVRERIWAKKVGDKMKLSIQREGEAMEVEVTLAKAPGE
jgi:S1-C subfamily serine protease